MKPTVTPAALIVFALVVAAMTPLSSPCSAQLSAGTILGRLPGFREADTTLQIRLVELSRMTIVQAAAPDRTGGFAFRSVPFAAYVLQVIEDERPVGERRVLVNTPIPVTLTLDSLRHYELEEVSVEAARGTFPGGPSPATSHSFYSARAIQDLPSASGPKTIEAILLNTPGVVPDEDGRLHVRGEDAQLQYVVDGIPITGNLTRVYASLFPAAFVKGVDIETGGLNAEYGVAASGILAITTKSGFDRPEFVQATGRFGSFNSGEGLIELGKSLGSWGGLYVAVARSSTGRYLDPITGGDPIHDHGDAESALGKLQLLSGERMDLTVLGLYDLTKFSIPNQFLRDPAQDQRQELEDYLIGARLNAGIGDAALLSGVVYRRQGKAAIRSGGLMQLQSASDVALAVRQNEKYFVGGDRKTTMTGGGIEISSVLEWIGMPQAVKAGVSGEIFPVREFLTFGVTNPALSDTGTTGGDDRFLPYDLTKGGRPFAVDRSATGGRFSAFLQDGFTSGRWTVNAGLRYDLFSLVQNEQAVSPRVGVTYRVSDDVDLRASYNRIVMRAPIENYLVSSSPEARALAGAEQGSLPTAVRSEKAHVLEAGGGLQLNRFLFFDLTGYTKFIDDFLVNVELGNSGVIFPVNLKRGFVAGGELRVVLREWNNCSATLSLTTSVSRGLVPADGSSPFAAGLVLGEEGEHYTNPFKGEDSFPTEHNQLLTAAFNFTYRHPSGLFGTLGGRFDSGLPFDLEGPHGEPLDAQQSRDELLRRGYTNEVIGLLDLNPESAGSPDRAVAPHVVLDMALGYEVHQPPPLTLRLTLSVLNVLDTSYLYKFESSFGGSHFGQPRTLALGIVATY